MYSYPERKVFMSSEWYSPGEIRFSGAQVRWMLSNWEELSEGQWIPQCEDTGYSGFDKRNCHAPYEMVMQVVGELDARLIACSTDRILTINYFNPYNLIDNMPSTRRVVNNVVRYCSGYKRQQLPYRLWLMIKREFRQKYRVELVL